MSKFKVGEIVKIVANKAEHRFEIGESVRILSSDQGDECKAGEYKAEHLDKRDYWFVDEEDIKAIKIVDNRKESTITTAAKRISRTRALELIKGSKGHFITVQFIKKEDGSLRTLNGQYSAKIQPTIGLGLITLREASKAKTNPKKSLRQFYIDNLKALKTGGIWYKIRK